MSQSGTNPFCIFSLEISIPLGVGHWEVHYISEDVRSMCTGVGVYDYILYGYGLLGEVEREINRRIPKETSDSYCILETFIMVTGIT